MRRRFVLFAAIAGAAAMVSVVSLPAQSDLSAKEELGKAIFFDQNLSLNLNQSCATCHGKEAGWTGPDTLINAHGAVYEGSIPGAFGDRKPPSVAYATQSPIFHINRKGNFVGGNFWDGRATGARLGNPAADQALGPFLNPKEQALPDPACVVHRVCTATYPVSFETVWGADSCSIEWPADTGNTCLLSDGFVALSPEDRAQVLSNYDRIGLSIAAYEASPEVNAFSSKFDLSKTGKVKLSKEEQNGFALFTGKGKCSQCHLASGKQPLFTDYTYDNLGLPKNPENPVYEDNPDFVDPGLGGFLETRADYASYAAENMGKHKVPTVRNVGLGLPAITKAFGHNGYFKSLEGIVHFYNTRDVKEACPGDYTEAQARAANCWPAPEVPQNLNVVELGNLGLTPAEEAAIVAFLKTLSDGDK